MSADLTDFAQRIADVGAPAFGELAAALDGESVPSLAQTVCDLENGLVAARQFIDRAAELLAEVEGDQQLNRGSFNTPWILAKWFAERVEGTCEKSGGESVLDPACGVGHLLVARAIRYGVRRPHDWHGWDLSEACVHSTRIGLWLASNRVGKVGDFVNVTCRDALLDPSPVQVDRVVANPPFVSIRRLVRTWGRDYVDAIRERFPEVRGSFDLYVPFVLRILGSLKPGGRFGVILPATIWTAAYAGPARSALSGPLDEVHRFAQRSIFAGAAVTPHIVVGERGSVAAVREFDSRLDGDQVTSVPEDANAAASQTFSAETIPLGDVAEVHGGTPGYDAHRIAAGLREVADSEADESLPFVVTSCIDPYELRFGPVRFIKRRFERPVVPIALLTDAKRGLFQKRKILVAGVCKRLEAVRDHHGVALGVGVYAVVPKRVASELLVALLNSEVMSRWYRRRFQGRELSGGYFGVNSSHIKRLPVPLSWLEDGSGELELVELVRRREDSGEAARNVELDALIEARVVSALGG